MSEPKSRETRPEPTAGDAAGDAAGAARSEGPEAGGISRRRALARLGIAAGVVYSAPTIVRLDRSANAKVLPSPCPPPGRGTPPPGC